MRILLVHQNFPGQFVHLAPALARRGHEVLALTDASNKRPSPVPTVQYTFKTPEPNKALPLSVTFAENAARGERAARAAAQLKAKRGFEPDVVLGHMGWGETMFLKEVWPQARLIVYAELFYRPRGLDTFFDPEIQPDSLWERIWITSRQAHLLLGMHTADVAIAPTRYQAQSFPEAWRDKIHVVHDGIDTNRLKPDPTATVTLPGTTLELKAGQEILTFVNRTLEPYRGYHIFMRALPHLLAARPEAKVVIVGGDGLSYSPRAKDGRDWKSVFLDEVKDRIDPGRVHFVGNVPYPTFVKLMQVTRTHCYLTYPFVLSWSMLEAMSAGALVVGSRTPPVEELIEDGVNGRLVDFFDVEGLARTLAEGLAEPERFAGLRQAARRTILERYDLETRCLPRLIDIVEGKYGEARR